MKKLIFIIPYFGKFNNYFQLFLDSCSRNKGVDWLIYTDDITKYNFPKNVKVKYITFDEFKLKIQEKFPYNIKLKRPYKLCDFKPLYGYLFKEDIIEYEYWGHCDTDIIWGNIEKLLFNKLKDSVYDKLFFLGHCTIYKNDKLLTEFFKKLINSNVRFKEVFQSEQNYSFDEEFNQSINNIFLENKKQIYLKELEANIYTKSSNFNLIFYDFKQNRYKVKKNKNFLMIYDKGNLYGYSNEKNFLEREEYLYIHMQARKMKIKCKNNNFYKIIPNSFEDIEVEEITIENFREIKKKNVNIHYFRHRSKNLYIKLKKILGIRLGMR